MAYSPITDLVGDRVWAGRTDPVQGYNPTTDGAALVLSIRGGDSEYTGHLLTPSVQFQCYAATELEADELYRVVFDRFHKEQNIESGRVMAASKIEQLGQNLEEPSVGWPFVLAFFVITFRNY